MKIFIFEHICGGGLSQVELPSGLIREGGAMLGALVEDALSAGHDVVTTLDHRVEMPKAYPLISPRNLSSVLRGQLTIHPVGPGEAMNDVFAKVIPQCGGALFVAPEFDHLLLGWQAKIVRAGDKYGVKNLGSHPDAIIMVSDKLTTHFMLRKLGIPTPMTYSGLDMFQTLLRGSPAGVVAKPRSGAGCLDTFVCRSEADVQALPKRDDWIMQHYVQGRACSVAFIVHDGIASALRAGEQAVSVQGLEPNPGKLGYGGGRMALEPELESRAIALGLRAVDAVADLVGFVGVDLVLGATAADDVVIEINPRPTVAYAGLRQLSSVNLISRLIDPRVPAAWHDLIVSYTSDGRAQVI